MEAATLRNVNLIDILREGGREGGGEVVAGQEQWFHPFLRGERKEGIQNRLLVTLTLQAMYMTLIADRMSVSVYWTWWCRWTHFSPAIIDCTVMKSL